MISVIIYILVSVTVIVIASMPIINIINVFKSGQVESAKVVAITPFIGINKNEQYKIEVVYEVNGHSFTQLFFLKKTECRLKIGDSVTVIYEANNPRNAHISADTDSSYFHFRKLVIAMTAVIVFAIASKNIFVFFSKPEKQSIITFMLLGYAAVVFLSVLAIYIYISIQLSRSMNTIEGIVVNGVEHKNGRTYKVRYTAKNCDFTLLCNSKSDISIGSIVKVTFLDNMPFISRIAK